MLDGSDAAAERNPHHHGKSEAPGRPVRHLRELGDDLVEGRENKPVELDFAHRPVAPEREPDRGTDDAGLGERGVEHSVLAEVLLQAVRDPEDAAELADVLAHDEHLGVLFHRLAQALVECPA